VRKILLLFLMAVSCAGGFLGAWSVEARADCAKEAPESGGWALLLVREGAFDGRTTTFRCTVLQAEPPLPREVEFMTPGGRQPDGALVEVESIRPDGRHRHTCLLLPDEYCLVRYVLDGERHRPVRRWSLWIPGQPAARSPETMESLDGWRAAEFQRRLDARAFDDLVVYEESVNQSGPRRIVAGPPNEAHTFRDWKRQQPENGAAGDGETGEGVPGDGEAGDGEAGDGAPGDRAN